MWQADDGIVQTIIRHRITSTELLARVTPEYVLFIEKELDNYYTKNNIDTSFYYRPLEEQTPRSADLEQLSEQAPRPPAAATLEQRFRALGNPSNNFKQTHDVSDLFDFSKSSLGTSQNNTVKRDSSLPNTSKPQSAEVLFGKFQGTSSNRQIAPTNPYGSTSNLIPQRSHQTSNSFLFTPQLHQDTVAKTYVTPYKTGTGTPEEVKETATKTTSGSEAKETTMGTPIATNITKDLDTMSKEELEQFEEVQEIKRLAEPWKASRKVVSESKLKDHLLTMQQRGIDIKPIQAIVKDAGFPPSKIPKILDKYMIKYAWSRFCPKTDTWQEYIRTLIAIAAAEHLLGLPFSHKKKKMRTVSTGTRRAVSTSTGIVPNPKTDT